MSTRAYETLIRHTPSGLAMSHRTITTVDGRDYISDPMPLTGEGLTDLKDPAVTALAELFSADIVAERDALTEQLAAAVTAKEAAAAERATTIETLKTQIDELEAAAAPEPGTLLVRDVIGKLPAEKLALAFNAALQSPPLLQFFLLMLADTGIRADDPRTVAGLAAFVQSGLLTEAEAAALFAE